MFQRRSKRFRRRSNGRGRLSHGNGGVSKMLGAGAFSHEQTRNNFRNSSLSAEKLFEKYSTLAKEAMSSGDKTLSENYLQHADHFARIIEDKNRNQKQNKINIVDKTAVGDKSLPENTNSNSDNPSKDKG